MEGISPNLPALQNTIFGYIVAGTITNTCQSSVVSHHVELADIDSTLRKFWEIEESPHQTAPHTKEEQDCESHFMNTHYIDQHSGRYTVRIPFKSNHPPLGDSLDMAIRRFKTLERRFQQNPSLHQAYCEFMKEYENLGPLEPIPKHILNSNVEHSYLPHHAVLRPTSTTTKLRVVFDGSAATSTGTALNEILLVGPKNKRDLFPILLSFRTNKIAITADVEKMFRMILVDKQDRNYQRVVWRKCANEPIGHYWLNTVTYGTASEPFLATRALKQVAIEFQGSSPSAEEAIKTNFYVDDLMTGADSVEETIHLKQELFTLLEKRGFQLRKWTSNSQTFLDTLPKEKQGISSIRIHEDPDSVNVLGLKWIPATDYFTFDVITPITSLATKRSILSESSRLFDPLGFLAPVTVLFKMMLQTLWLNNYDWDQPISETLAQKWHTIRNSLNNLQNIHVPRWLATEGEAWELHGFSDAAEGAYAAVVYCRSTSLSGRITVTVVAAKTRVAPVKQVSIPRLELCGALLLTRLFQSIKEAFNRPNLPCYAWSDSEVVLAWLSSHPRKWKTFVGNRTAEILTILPRSFWNHVPSEENPADIASRGSTPQQLFNSRLWWCGPPWLQNDWTNRCGARLTTYSQETEIERRQTNLDTFVTIIQNEPFVQTWAEPEKKK